ncbi:MAG: Mur ligase family protein [Firmicutes bacterium]|nr:Mur ligase family protein [Bacillota bacterium]
MRLWLAIIVGKICAFASRLLKRGGGSSLPGSLARRIEPHILVRLLEKAGPALTSIIITGSNGKTTTARMVAEVLQHNGLRIVWNRSGANMVSGIISALIERCDIWGRLSADAAVFEVDEANLRHVVAAIRPRIILVTNCFRDQLDRYGEVDTTLGLIRAAIEDAPAGSLLLLNADDPLVASLASRSRCKTMFYGIEGLDLALDLACGHAPGHAQAGRVPDMNLSHDARSCPNCGAYYEYSLITYGHLGKYRCPRCLSSRPAPDFLALNVVAQGAHGFTFTVGFEHDLEHDPVRASLGLPGLYNVYNCLAAVACCLLLDIPRRIIEEGIARSSSAFGRMETIPVGDRNVLLALVKNPVGFSEVIRTIVSEASEIPGVRRRLEAPGIQGTQETQGALGAPRAPSKTLMVCLNDNFADGRDISWIWDVDMERLSRNPSFVRSIVASGTRAEDMALRLKYAGIDQEKIYIEPDLDKALELGLRNLAPGETLYVLPTYTALLEVREHIRRRRDASHAREFWRA